MENEKRLDLIDRYALMDKIKGNGNPDGLQNVTPNDVYVFAIASVETAPTVDAVEVVHGRWEKVIPTKSAAKWSTKVSCSVCHKQGYTYHKFCPSCGAKMDGDGSG